MSSVRRNIKPKRILGMNFLYNNSIILIILFLGLLATLIWQLVTSLKETKITSLKAIPVCSTSTQNETSYEAKTEIIKEQEESLSLDKSMQEEPINNVAKIEPSLNEKASPKDKKDFLSNYCQEKSKNNKTEKLLFTFGAIAISLLVLSLTYYLMNFCVNFGK